jgi:GT2 family glycosyltransferase
MKPSNEGPEAQFNDFGVVACKKDVLCIVLSYNGREDTSACLRSILTQKPEGLDVIVIDNASATGVVESLTTLHPDIEIVSLTENLGWAGGNNVGIKIGLERGYKWLCLLNNDIEFPDGQLDLWFASINRSSPCLLHPSIYYWSEPELAQVHPNFDGRPDCYTQHDLWQEKAVMNFAYGACLAIHSEILTKTDLFDERFFLQLEETDFYHRAIQLKYHAVCDPSIKIFHKESRAFGGKRAPIKTYYSVRNTFLLIEKKGKSLSSKLNDLKSLYWSLCNLATDTEEAGHIEKREFFKWIFSSSPSAKAVRLGTRDYILRRFGKISDASYAKLKPESSLLTVAKPM